MIVAGVCATCGEYRVRSTREYRPGEALDPADFEPLGDQPPPTALPMTCFGCGEPLVFRRMSTPGRPTARTLPSTADNGATRGAKTLTVFEAGADETITEIRDFPNDRLLIKTTRRIVLVDLVNWLVTEEP